MLYSYVTYVTSSHPPVVLLFYVIISDQTYQPAYRQPSKNLIDLEEQIYKGTSWWLEII